MSTLSRHVSAPRGATITCKGWPQEAALRMLMNNLDPEVAERPDDLVVYGGSGRAARSWPAFDAIVATLLRLEHDETLVVQSGKPVAVFRTHPWAPRVLIANALLVPAWATWAHFRDLEDRGLTMYGQMTAGSWIYIGTQGILQGTYETLAELARRHFGGTLSGRLVVTAGLGGMGGAQPLAVTMNGGVALVVEVDPSANRAAAGDALRRRADRGPRRGARARRRLAAGGRRPIHRARGQRRRRPARARATRRDAGRRDRSDVGARRAQRICPQRHDAPRSRGAAPREPRRVHASAPWRRWPTTSERCSGSSATARSSSTTATTSARRPSRAASPRRSTSRASCPSTFARSSARARDRFAGRRSRAILPTSRRPTTSRSRCSTTTRRSAGGYGWRASASPFRDCRRESSGSATATARGSAWRSTISSGAAS